MGTLEQIFSALDSLKAALDSDDALPEFRVVTSPDGSFWAFSTHPMSTMWALASPLPPGTIEELLKLLPEANEDLYLIVLGKEGDLAAAVIDTRRLVVIFVATLVRRENGWMLTCRARQEGEAIKKERLPIAPDSGMVEALRFFLREVIAKNVLTSSEESISPAGDAK